MRYRYIGDETNKHLPKFNLFVQKKGDIVETDKEIDNPDFALVEDDEKQEEKPEEDTQQEVENEQPIGNEGNQDGMTQAQSE